MNALSKRVELVPLWVTPGLTQMSHTVDHGARQQDCYI